jgi:hypothetical protein
LAIIVPSAVKNRFDKVLEMDRVISEFPPISLVFLKKLVDAHDDMLHRVWSIVMDRQDSQVFLDVVEWGFDVGNFVRCHPTLTSSNVPNDVLNMFQVRNHGSNLAESFCVKGSRVSVRDHFKFTTSRRIVAAIDAKWIELNGPMTGRRSRAVVITIPNVNELPRKFLSLSYKFYRFGRT